MRTTKLLGLICPVAIAMSFGNSATAQHKLYDIDGIQSRFAQSYKDHFTMSNGQLAPIPNSPSGAAKPTVMTSRIIAMYTQKSDGAQYLGVNDSTRFYWSGTRGRGFDYAKFILRGTLPGLYDPNPVKNPLDLELFLYKNMNLDSFNTFTWDAGSNSFSTPHTRTVTTFTTAGLLNTAINKSLTAGVWENSLRNILTWSNDKNLTSLQADTWDGALWEGDYKSILNYDGLDNYTEVVSQEWDNGSTSWIDKSRIGYSYTGNDMSAILNQDWNTGTNLWINKRRQNLGYDNGQWISGTFQDWNTLTNVWDTDEKYTYTYNQDGKLTIQLLQDWNSLTNVWENDSRMTFVYEPNGDLTSITTHNWSLGSWEPNERYVYAYTTGSQPTTTISRQSWNAGTNTWDNEKRFNVKYNEHDRITELTYQTWDVSGFWDVVSGDNKYNFIYETFEDGSNKIDQIAKSTDFRYYPNPSTTFITVETDNSTITQIRLMDVTGRTVSELTPVADTRNVNMPTAQLTPGVYFLQVMHGGKTETEPVQVQRSNKISFCV